MWTALNRNTSGSRKLKAKLKLKGIPKQCFKITQRPTKESFETTNPQFQPEELHFHLFYILRAVQDLFFFFPKIFFEEIFLRLSYHLQTTGLNQNCPLSKKFFTYRDMQLFMKCPDKWFWEGHRGKIRTLTRQIMIDIVSIISKENRVERNCNEEILPPRRD